jgi:hypothetical protein
VASTAQFHSPLKDISGGEDLFPPGGPVYLAFFDKRHSVIRFEIDAHASEKPEKD